MSGPAPGWYDDPTMVKTRRYWDGQQWTEHRQERAAPAQVYVQADLPSSAAVSWGYLLGIFLPVVGFFIGLALLGKRGNDGLKIVLVSVAAFIVWAVILTMVAQENAADNCRSTNSSLGLPTDIC